MTTNLGGYAWLVLLLLITGYELWAGVTNRQTLSEWVWWYNASHPWFMYVVLTGVTILMLHFFANLWR